MDVKNVGKEWDFVRLVEGLPIMVWTALPISRTSSAPLHRELGTAGAVHLCCR